MAKTSLQQLALHFGDAARLGLATDPTPSASLASVPDYLRVHYWWAYIHPRGVHLFERQWVVNLILLGNYTRLCDAALGELGEVLPGATLQVACVYGDLSVDLHERAAAGGGALDIVDVLPIQIQNLRKKLPSDTSTRLMVMDSMKLRLPDRSYDRALLFFLLHEQPPNVREQTLREIFRVLKPGGRVVIVDYAKPRWWNPLRYLWRPLLARLEPFALDLWHQDVRRWLPKSSVGHLHSRRFFGGLYQVTTVTLNQVQRRLFSVGISAKANSRAPIDEPRRRRKMGELFGERDATQCNAKGDLGQLLNHERAESHQCQRGQIAAEMQRRGHRT